MLCIMISLTPGDLCRVCNQLGNVREIRKRFVGRDAEKGVGWRTGWFCLHQGIPCVHVEERAGAQRWAQS